MRSLAAVCCLVASGCADPFPRPSSRYHISEKGPYQVLYAPDRTVERILYDGNGDGQAEIVTYYARTRLPVRAELDTDGDGVVDRWEYFSLGGELQRVGLSRGRSGVPDAWQILDRDR